MIRFRGADPCNCTPRRPLIPAHCCPPPGVSFGELLTFADEFVNEPVSGAPLGWTAVLEPGSSVGRDTFTSIRLLTGIESSAVIFATDPRIRPSTDEVCACSKIHQVAPAPPDDSGGTGFGLVEPVFPDPGMFVAAISFAVPGFWAIIWRNGGPMSVFPTTIPVTNAPQTMRLCVSPSAGTVTLSDGTITETFLIDANFPAGSLAPVVFAQGLASIADARVDSYCAEWRPG